MSTLKQPLSRYVVKHSRGFLNIDRESIIFSRDGNWGNLSKGKASDIGASQLWDSINEIKHKESKAIGITMAAVSSILMLIAIYFYSLIGLFLAISTAYLAWAALRVTEIEDIHLNREIVSLSKGDDETVQMVVSIKGKEPLTIPLRNISASDWLKMHEDFNEKAHG